ncbi:class I SAM-dependent methyltransferase [Vallitalea guaymasensis]|uniref:class I SAM-dependent methyltransferase n=1 Tax=Vallitalea guaymasensis TaxID=1185412 RepID=UPI000DE4AA45|nr:methyltransferase domain-containing protein [Vallitalea guaymasensis]
MDKKNRCMNEHSYNHKRTHRRGPSSYHMHNPDVVINELNIKKGDSFLDLGCGSGDYSIQAAGLVGDSGMVYALDIWGEVLEGLNERAGEDGITNIKTKVCNIKENINLDDNSIDICFISTVLHTIDLSIDGKRLFDEIDRVLKPRGRIVIIECKKGDYPVGPPMSCRISPEEFEEFFLPYGFEKNSYVDLGYNYMISFKTKILI